MTALAIVGSTVGGAIIGGIIGLWVGFATDKGDFPIMGLFTGPLGALIGALAGCIISAGYLT